ncbi:MAG: mandelate racemase/muconate lactonizing enzyme family protein [Bryobacteraceae bacterium]|nr:mandelate racemase/muconate lactonizing enzyme family protein [Bryobacteraceae bacterium]
MTRRAALGVLGGAASFARPNLTIERLEIFEVKVNRRGNWLLARLTASGGVTGLGDASHGPKTSRAFLEELFALVRGRSAFDIEWLRAEADSLVRQRGYHSAVAVSAFEQAMWDIQGKALGVPCYELFGGALRKTIRHYANINRCTFERTPAGFAASAERAVRSGFDAIKLAPFDGLPKPGTPKFQEGVNLGVACIEAVRKVLGPKGDLLVDGHSHFDVDSGIALAKRLEPLNLFWLEEVTPPSGLPAIDRAASMKTAGGESIYGLREFNEYMRAGSVDIAMPDVKYCGGMLSLKKIAGIAEGYGIPVAPHGPASPIGNVAAAHVCATLPNFSILELGFGEVDWRGDLVRPREEFSKGVLALSDRPGLGIELNEALARAQSGG